MLTRSLLVYWINAVSLELSATQDSENTLFSIELKYCTNLSLRFPYRSLFKESFAHRSNRIYNASFKFAGSSSSIGTKVGSGESSIKDLIREESFCKTASINPPL